ncbi:MAG: Chaperone protein DnaK [candidate division BRC1 bacterium ADurb.Bin183]|nr:MAG: Chaperone protein DnaK [candidate division BRC1 bacterium ADurb.Bin183]
MEPIEGKIIGIDFGTTNSLAAYVEGSEPVIISNPEGVHKTPSVVAFLENKEVIVGEIARRQAPTNARRTIQSIKRLMGRSYSDVIESGEQFSFNLLEKDDQIIIDIDGMGYRPEQITALILQKLKESAEMFLNEPIQQAIISVPAYFDDLQRNATKEAARLAGLEVLRLINEPTAAAMAYGLGRKTEEVVAVYDFGGGTFDISILEINNNAFEVIVSNGDTHLGGDDLDNAIVRMIADEFQRQHGVNLADDPVTLYRLKEVAEKAKCELSMATHTLISLPFVAYKDKTPIHLERTISRREFEAIIAPFVDRTIKCCRDALDAGGVARKDISKVILVGGTSRIPLVQDEVEDFFEIAPFKGVNPDEIVALGAATHGGVFSGKLEEVVLLDVTPHSLGVEVKDGKVSHIIEKNSTIPIKAAKTFTTTENNQSFVNIHVVQGEGENTEDCRSLGKFTLSDIEPAAAGIPRIRISFFINSDGVVEISANDMASGKEKKLTITHSFLTSDEKKKQKFRKRQRLATGYAPRTSRAESASQDIIYPVGSQIAPEPTYDTSELKGRFQPVSDAQISPTDTPPYPTPPGEVAAQPIPLQTPQPAQPATPREIHEASTILYTSESISQAAQTPPKPVPKPPTMAPEPSVVSPAAIPRHIMPINQELLLTVQKAIAKEERSEEALAFYTKFFEHVAELQQKGVDIPSSIYPTLSAAYVLSRFPEEARNTIRFYEERPDKETPDSLEAYEFLIKHYPNYKLAIRERASLYQQLKKYKEAFTSLESLQRQAEDEEIQTTLETLYEEYLQENKDPVIEFKLVKLYLKKNKLDEAIGILQSLAKDEGYRPRALKILGLTYWQKNMFTLAWHTFKLLPSSAELTDILYRLANDVEKVGDLANAREIYQRISDNAPNYKDVAARWKKIDYRLQLQQKEAEGARSVPILENSRFLVLEEVNRGSMGVIYKARDKVVGDIVAIKVLNDYLCQDPKAVERFKSEARAAKKLSHPYIVRIHDLFESGRQFFLSMEFIEGTDLKKMISNKIQFSEETITQYFLQMCDALTYAHSLGIIHRDIKPANIMILPFNTIKITDFGIAKILKSDAVTQSGTAVIGTPLYMAPEQIMGKGVDARTDIYSLGIMLYEMVTGNPPFCQGNIEYHHVHTEPPAIEGNVSDKLKGIITKMIAKSPEDRFQSIQEIFQTIRDT